MEVHVEIAKRSHKKKRYVLKVWIWLANFLLINKLNRKANKELFYPASKIKEKK